MKTVQEKRMEAFHVVEEIRSSFSVPFAFEAAVQMRIPDILAAAGPDASLTAQQIADKLPRKGHDAARKLGRILRLLAHKGVFAEEALSTTDHSESNGPRYGLTDVSKLLVTDSEFDLTPFALLSRRTGGFEFLALKHLCEAVEDDADASELAFGMDPWSYAKSNPSYNAIFNEAMRSLSKVPNNTLAHHYEGFKDVKCLVDVGGGMGGALALIVAAHPHIRGINFDLPHVVSSAPTIPGVEHVSGSFLEFVPSGDTILIQHVLHNWGDEDCIKILKNCHQALPENGKLLIQENVMDPARDSDAKAGAALNVDLLMMALFKGVGGERTSVEYKRLLAAAGFSSVAFRTVRGLDLIESIKT